VIRVVYIAGASHSGSTLLHLMLGAHSRCVGLGEAARTLGPGEGGLERTLRRHCSCGSAPRDCLFWGEAISQLQGERGETLEDRYRGVLATFADVFGSERILVDSSKALPPLRVLARLPEVDLRVVHVIKDVRAWVTSQDDLQREESARARGVETRGLGRLFREWYRKNREIGRFLGEENLPTLRLGYEELCFFPEAMVEMLCQLLGEEPETSMLSPDAARCHMLRGNKAAVYHAQRSQTESTAIQYDHRWLCRNDWLLWSLLHPRIMRFNRSEVYGNAVVPDFRSRRRVEARPAERPTRTGRV
jgi:hypothetical protein